MKPARLTIVGIGGYGRSYVAAAKKMEEEGLAVLHSVVIRNRRKYAKEVKEYEARGVPIRGSLEEMLELDAKDLDLITIPTGIDQHRRMMIPAVEAGCDVIMEKPPTATIQDMDAMIAALERTGRWCQIGFQSQSSTRVRGLKRLICDGKLGRILNVAAKGQWVRLDSYYERNPWAGKFYHDGTYILDGTINNPLAHYLMNGMYFASTEWNRIATPARVRAEIYKGHHIESEDTSAVEVECENGARVYFLATLCANESADVEVEIVGENGKARWIRQGDVKIEYKDGTTETLADTDQNPRDNVFRNAIRHLRGEDAELNCPLQMTRPFVLTVNGAFESSRGTHKIPDSMLNISEDPETKSIRTEIPDINDIVDRAFAERRLYSDMGIEWAVKTDFFPLEGYTRFEMQPQRAE